MSKYARNLHKLKQFGEKLLSNCLTHSYARQKKLVISRVFSGVLKLDTKKTGHRRQLLGSRRIKNVITTESRRIFMS